MQGIGNMGIVGLIMLTLALYIPSCLSLVYYFNNYQEEPRLRRLGTFAIFALILLGIFLLGYSFGPEFEIWFVITAVMSTVLFIGSFWNYRKRNKE